MYKVNVIDGSMLRKGACLVRIHAPGLFHADKNA